MKRNADGAEKDPRIRLNVGGRRMETKKSVLCAVKGSMLERMFCGDVPAVADEDGSYFFDRDGKIFERYVLRYLRGIASIASDEFISPRIAPDLLFFVETEFDFFGIPFFENKKDEFDAVRLRHHTTVCTGLTPISRAVVHRGLLIVQSGDDLRPLVKIFDLKTGEKRSKTFEGKLASSGTGAADDALFVIASYDKLKRYDLGLFRMSTEFHVDEECTAFVLAKERVVSVTDESGGRRLRAYDSADSTRYARRSEGIPSGKLIGIFFDGNDKVFLVCDRRILTYILKGEKDDPILHAATVRLVAAPVVAAVVCDSNLCTATNNKIQIWDDTDFEEDKGKKFSFGLGKVKAVASIGKYVVASTGPCGDKIKIYDRDHGPMIDQFGLEFEPSCFDSAGRRLLLGKSDGDLEIWKC